MWELRRASDASWACKASASCSGVTPDRLTVPFTTLMSNPISFSSTWSWRLASRRSDRSGCETSASCTQAQNAATLIARCRLIRTT